MFGGNYLHVADADWSTAARVLTLDELTNLVGMTPYYCFGFTAANGALLEAFEGRKEVHILDFSTTHCMQWPTLIQALADRTGVGLPPHVRLTVCNPTHADEAQQHNICPRVKATYEYLGSRLTHFAASRGISFTFHILSRPLEDLEAADFGLRGEECVAVNCSLRLHYLAEESAAGLQVQYSARSSGKLLKLIYDKQFSFCCYDGCYFFSDNS